VILGERVDEEKSKIKRTRGTYSKYCLIDWGGAGQDHKLRRMEFIAYKSEERDLGDLGRGRLRVITILATNRAQRSSQKYDSCAEGLKRWGSDENKTGKKRWRMRAA